MKSLAQVISELDSVLTDLDLNSVEIQALKLFFANSLYLNEALGTSISLESNPLTCLNRNSAIMHAAANKYKVFRGKNPRATLFGLTPTQDFKVKRYDTFLELEGYKLVYANDEVFTFGRTDPFDVILTKDVIAGSFDVTNKYSYTITTPLSEDIVLYDVIENSDEYQVIELKDKINANDDSSTVYQLTISDYGVKLLSLNKFVEHNTHYYKALPLIEENVDLQELLESISSVPYFMSADVSDGIRWYGIAVTNSELGFYAVTSYTKLGSGSTTYYDYIRNVMEPESDMDKIYLNSITQANTGDSMKSTADLTRVISKLTSDYYNKVYCFIQPLVAPHDGITEELVVYYTLRNESNEPNVAWLNNVINQIGLMYYNSSMDIRAENFHKATAYSNWIYDPKDAIIEYSSDEVIDSVLYSAVESYQSEVLGGTFNSYELLFYIQKTVGSRLTMLRPATDTATCNFMITPVNLTVGDPPTIYTVDLSKITIKRL